jgi:hypothetical protein
MPTLVYTTIMNDETQSLASTLESEEHLHATRTRGAGLGIRSTVEIEPANCTSVAYPYHLMLSSWYSLPNHEQSLRMVCCSYAVRRRRAPERSTPTDGQAQARVSLRVGLRLGI